MSSSHQDCHDSDIMLPYDITQPNLCMQARNCIPNWQILKVTHTEKLVVNPVKSTFLLYVLIIPRCCKDFLKGSIAFEMCMYAMLWQMFLILSHSPCV